MTYFPVKVTLLIALCNHFGHLRMMGDDTLMVWVGQAVHDAYIVGKRISDGEFSYHCPEDVVIPWGGSAKKIFLSDIDEIIVRVVDNTSDTVIEYHLTIPDNIPALRGFRRAILNAKHLFDAA